MSVVCVQCSSIEFAVVSARVFEALKLGNATLQRQTVQTYRAEQTTEIKQANQETNGHYVSSAYVSMLGLNAETSIEDVERLMDDNAEALEYQQVT